jgi:hypothetical protein
MNKYSTEYKLKKLLHKENNNCSIIKKIDIEKIFFLNDKDKEYCNWYKDYTSLYSLKYNYHRIKKHYLIFVQNYDDIVTLKDVKDEIYKMHRMWYFAENLNNKYYTKFLRRLKYNILDNFYIYITSKNIDDDALKYINDINSKDIDIHDVIEDYSSKKKFYDFMRISYIQHSC